MLLGLCVFAWQLAVLALLAGPGSALSLLQGDVATRFVWDPRTAGERARSL